MQVYATAINYPCITSLDSMKYSRTLKKLVITSITAKRFPTKDFHKKCFATQRFTHSVS